MKINFEEIEQKTGLCFQDIEQLYFYVLSKIETLKVNNKNYTKKQYYIIDDLFSFITSISWEE